MDCREIKNLLSEHIDNVLNPETKNIIENHLISCKDCRNEYESLKNCMLEIQSLERVKAPENISEKIYERLENRSKVKIIINKLFLPFYIKIPLEIAAAFLLVLMINNFHKDKSHDIQVAYKELNSDKEKKSEAVLKDEISSPQPKETILEKSGIEIPGNKMLEKEAKRVEVASLITEINKEEEVIPEKPVEIAAERNELKEDTNIIALPEEEFIQLALLIEPKEEIKNNIEGKLHKEKAMESFQVNEYSRSFESKKRSVKYSNAPEISEKGSENLVMKGKSKLVVSNLKEVVSRIKDITAILDGTVLSIENENGTDNPQYINIEIPVSNYVEFVGRIGAIGKVQKPFSGIPSADDSMIKIHLEIKK